MQHFIAIDLGTTNCKTVVIDESCHIVHTNKIAVNSILQDDGTHEQNAEEIFQAVIKLLQQYLQGSDKNIIACVSFSAAMHSFMAVDKNGNPLMNAMTWADTRSKKYAIELRNSETGKNIYAQTGTPIHAMSPLCKLLWLKNEKPQIFNAADKFISIKEFIYSKLFNKYIIDEGIACSTGLYNIYDNKWNKQSLQLAGIDESKLSTVVATTHYETELLHGIKTQLNLTNDIPFVMGGNDGCLANFGCGALSKDTAVLTLGTSGAVRLTIPKPILKELNGLFRYILTKEVYVTGGPINNGGIVLEWFAKNFLNIILEQDDNFDKVMRLAAKASPTSEGLMFLPYLLGERAPVWDENACGIFYNLKMNHEKEHLTRAVIEGISFSLLQILNNIEEQNNTVDGVYVSGFVTNSDFWMQLLADMFGKKIILNEVADASAVGAALIGMYATGFIKNVYEVKKFLKTDKVFIPDDTNHVLYQKHFERYKKLYPAFKVVS
ncbi:gluconate kinase [Panacibacter ginsenosidivorans]|uniref:Gluconate kinase n=1 Tax=Panacibacter ginsenosidivorans TaxID=1813871 RepID=A0A5B8VBU6_9BACT|nr:gluconokinase [Panacibacter ginsenosidivorans]QEC68904.1 gluconate kinase [Panacibacter ginsenosidivorans]